MLTQKVSLGPAGKESTGESRQGGPEAMKGAILVTSGGFLGLVGVSGHWRRERGFGGPGIWAVFHATFVRIGASSPRISTRGSAVKKFRKKNSFCSHKRKKEAFKNFFVAASGHPSGLG